MKQVYGKQNIGQLFDHIAGTYDRFNHLLSLNSDKRWRRKAASLLRPATDVLDAATGTGDLAIELLRQGKAQHITGIDLSTAMMEIGRRKAEAAGMEGKISFMEASALEMPFGDGTFDTVTCAYGVRNFRDLDKGLAEMHRVLRDGGQLMILEFSYPENRIIRRVYDIFFTHVMPFVGKLMSKDKAAYTYFRESVKGFIWGEEMLEHLRGAGFTNTAFRALTFGITTIYTAEKQ